MEGKPKVKFITLGCKVNQYESEAISERLIQLGFSSAEENEHADVCIINTCTVTSEADRKSRQMIRRAIKNNPEAKIIVTGCGAQIDYKRISSIPGVDAVIGNKEKLTAVETAVKLLNESEQRGTISVSVPELNTTFEQMNIVRSERTRAYIKIEDGCESKCAYCIIPKARGPIRSKPADEIISEVSGLVCAGYKEIVLTGIEVSAYGNDIGTKLTKVLEMLDNISGLERIGFSSIDPAFLRNEFIDSISHLSHISPHFHLSLQSGCDKVLAAMRRKYNTGMVRDYTAHIRKKMPGVCFTCDVIVGFPGESDEDFNQTCEFIRSLEPLALHVFPYSKRPGTEAEKMSGQIEEQIKKSRSEKLISIGKECRVKVLAQIAECRQTADVLFESCEGVSAPGRLFNYAEIVVKTNLDLQGKILSVRITGTDGEKLFGELLK